MSQGQPGTYEIDIQAPAERVWQALTDPELTQQYYFNTRVETDWNQGSEIKYRNLQGNIDLEGEILEYDPPRRLVTTFRPTWAPQMSTAPSTVSWEVTPSGTTSTLRLRHEGLDQMGQMADMIHNSWLQTLSSLKSLLETGQASNPTS